MELRNLVGASALLTFALLLLGVYTAAAGAGLTCAQNWPLCDGAVFGLFPADWLSFVEWFHRLVAMITGFAILGTTVAAWRRGADRGVRYALALATVLLPAQIALGALTVTVYEWLILTLHFVTALLIFGGVVAAAAWTYADHDYADVRPALRASLLSFPVFAVLSPRVVFVYSPPMQVAYYAVGLALLSALVAAVLWQSAGRARLAAGVATLLVGAQLVAGRQVFGATGELLLLATTLVAFALTVAAVRLRTEAPSRPATA